jgi:hypothetical protein
MGSWIQTLNFVIFVVNGLIKGELEKPCSQFLGLIGHESLTCRCLNSNPGHFDGSTTFIFVSCGESRLFVSWCVGERRGMACSDEDHGRSRRPGVEDRGWSHRSGTQWLGDREVGWHCVRSILCTWRQEAWVS